MNADGTKKEKIEDGQPTRGIAIWLDDYNDIFSDFDSRGYDHRVISDDFLSEIRKISRENEEDVREIHLLLPEKARNKKDEEIIGKRLQQYFRKNHQQVASSIISERKKAVMLALTGLFFLLLGGYISFLKPVHLALHLLMITCEPAGWFLVWMGYDLFTNNAKRRKQELVFLEKITRSGISFRSLESQGK